MPAITATNMKVSGKVALTETTLDGSTDTLVYNASKNAVLILDNPTAGALTPVIDGDGGTTVGVAGLGSVDVSGGYSVGSIAVGDSVAIRLDTISVYLSGTIDVTGATGLIATLLEF